MKKIEKKELKKVKGGYGMSGCWIWYSGNCQYNGDCYASGYGQSCGAYKY